MRVLGINAVFHDPAAALVVDGDLLSAAEEERFSRRKHGKEPVPFSTWELPVQAARWCLRDAGLTPGDLDAVAYSYDPALAPDVGADVTADEWEGLRTLFARRAPRFLATALPGLDPERVHFVAHHVAHAASCGPASPHPTSAVLVLDGRGERTSHLAGRYREDGSLEILARQELPHSLGLLYEELTDHLGFRRSSDEYKVMAMASYGEPAFLDDLRRLVYARGDGGFATEPVDWERFAPRLAAGGDDWTSRHADLACSVQRRLEEVLLELATWLHERTGESALTMAGGVALNCVANMRLHASGPFDDVWVQPASGDSGTALGAALHVAHELGDRVSPMPTAALGRGWSDDELAEWLDGAGIVHERPDDLADAVAEVLAADGVVAWFQGRSEFGPRALGHRSLLADPRRPETTARLNAVKGRESFRPVAPMVLAERAAEIFSGRLPSEYMLFTHEVDDAWRDRIPAVVHVDGTARIQTVDRAEEPLMAAVLERFEERTGVPVVVNTSLNTAGRPMVDDPRDALECFGSAPVDLLAIGPFVVRRPGSAAALGRAAEEIGAR
jgi:carbamoyltransferase